jgi:CheY-like chemotaxis protein
LHVQTQLVDLGQVAALVADLSAGAALAKKIRLEVVRTAQPYIWGDPVRLQQALWNVVSNAIKFTPESGRVQLRIVRGPRHACVTIEDSGIGVDPAFLPKMFDRFTQGDQSPTRRFGGLGIGLAIVKDIVTLHGGTVRAESRGPYQGTSITMEFPIPALMDQPSAWLRARAANDRTEVRLDGVAILLVDDDIDTLTALENVLRHHGADVMRATSAQQALTLLTDREPTVIVADLSMPERDGLDLIREIRRLVSGRELPAAVLSAHTASDRERLAADAGFQVYIEKPVRPEVFVGHIATLAGLH